MSRKVVTVETLWKEWHDGIEGLWPVKDLEKDHGTKWRRNDMKWYNIRKKIIDAVEDLMQDKQLSTRGSYHPNARNDRAHRLES